MTKFVGLSTKSFEFETAHLMFAQDWSQNLICAFDIMPSKWYLSTQSLQLDLICW
jgi:hypothetical protein